MSDVAQVAMQQLFERFAPEIVKPHVGRRDNGGESMQSGVQPKKNRIARLLVREGVRFTH